MCSSHNSAKISGFGKTPSSHSPSSHCVNPLRGSRCYYPNMFRSIGLTLAVIVLSLAPVPCLGGPPTFTITFVGPFQPTALNNHSQVVGNTGNGSLFWDPAFGSVTLGVPAGFSGTTVTGLNDFGVISGFALQPTLNTDEAFVWTSQNPNDPVNIGGFASYALTVNNQGEVAGGELAGGFFTQVFTWTAASGTKLLGTFPGGSNTGARAINDSGDLAGWGNGTIGCCSDRAFYWSHVTGFHRIDPAPLFFLSYADAINNKGIVAGTFENVTGTSTVPYLLNTSTNTLTVISSIETDGPYQSLKINDAGWLVGTTAGHGAFLYIDGTEYLLSSLISGWTITQAVDVNAHNQILAYGTNGLQTGALLLTSSPLVITSLTATPNMLWPPDHKLVSVILTDTTAGGSGTVSCKITSVASNEPLDAGSDWVITDNLTVDLRADRSGSDKAGRIYTITVQCTDDLSSATKAVTVSVPHDQGH